MWQLPDPFLKADGTRLQERAAWDAQRDYLKTILQENFYGVMPEEPTEVKAELLQERAVLDGQGRFAVHRLRCGPNGSIVFEVYSVRPAQAPTHLPIVMNGGFFARDIAALAVRSGFGIYTYDSHLAAPDSSAAFAQGQCRQAYPQYSWRTIAMWGWVQRRIIDWLETQSDADTGRLTVCGHSRFGKAALCAAVHDRRIAACVAAGSGCGGFGSLRRIGSRYGEGTGYVETIGYMLRKGKNNHWFLESLQGYGRAEVNGLGRENELPFDADFIGAAIAPTPLLILEGLDDSWSNPFGTQLTWNAVSQVYDFLGVGQRLGLHYREGGHEFNLQDWTVMLDFLKVQFFGAQKTTRYKTRGEAEACCGCDWRAPGTSAGAQASYQDFKRALMRDYADYPGDRWVFGEAGIETETEKMVAELYAQTQRG